MLGIRMYFKSTILGKGLFLIMANRILLGNRSTGGYGLYVSKPSADVLTCGVDDLTFSTLDSTSTPFSANGIHQTVPFSGGTGNTAPDVVNDFTLSGGGDSTITYQDLGDNLAFEHSMRNFYAMPNTTIPNNQKEFAEFCYGNMPSCKDGDYFQCEKNNVSLRT